MIQVGDTVRYLNEVGGGIVTRVEGKIAYVDDAGFETPMQVSDLVVVLPAGHTPNGKGPKLMFDQEAFDMGKSDVRPEQKKPEPKAPVPAPEPEPLPVVETDYGDAMTITLAFEPDDLKHITDCGINAVLVNDSNYFLYFNLLRRDGLHGWTSIYRGEAGPNELVDLVHVDRTELQMFERVVLQAIAYKKDKTYDVQTPLNINRKIDLTKFYKLHCYRPGLYFETPVIEVQLYTELRR